MRPEEYPEHLQKVLAMPGYSVNLELSRTRKETGLTFSKEALEDYANTVAAFVTTRVMKYWEEHGEPPVHMDTLITVAINEKAEHPDG